MAESSSKPTRASTTSPLLLSSDRSADTNSRCISPSMEKCPPDLVKRVMFVDEPPGGLKAGMLSPSDTPRPTSPISSSGSSSCSYNINPAEQASTTGRAPPPVKRRPISKILIASNGLAAVKAMRSMRRWEAMKAHDGLHLKKNLTFVSLASSEDIAANAQFLQTVDNFVEVPGGRNVNNYANVDLICDIAQREKVDAVWPGWGHASENPRLPKKLAEIGVEFLGPTARVMQLLGDKIYANLMAQTANVP